MENALIKNTLITDNKIVKNNYYSMFPIIEYILLSGVIISAFLCLLLVRKRNKSSGELILLFWIFTSGYVIFSYLLVYNGSYLKFPTLTVMGFSIPLLSGPFMYLYIKYQTKPLFFQKIDLLHFFPFFISNLLFLRFYFMPFDLKVDVLRNASAFELEGLIKLIATFLSGVIYIIWCFIILYSYKKRLKEEFSNPDQINFNWLFMLNIGMLLIWIVVIFIPDDKVIFSAASIYIICIGFFGIAQSKVFTERDVIYIQNQDKLIEQNKATNADDDIKESSFSDVYFEKIYSQTIELLKQEKLYLNPELKVLDLAILLKIHPNLMSKVINHNSETSFYDLVNKMRVEEFIEKSKTEDSQKYTIMALAFDAGFNSKATFYRNFKTITGMSPSEFLKSSQMKSIN